MPESLSGLTQTAANLHRAIKALADAIGTLLVDGFAYLALFAIGATTVWSAAAAFFSMAGRGRLSFRTSFFCLFILNSARWSASISKRRNFRFAT